MRLNCQAFYPILTHCVVNFEVSNTVPVCCVATVTKVMLFPVEHKKLRIRHKMLCVNT